MTLTSRNGVAFSCLRIAGSASPGSALTSTPNRSLKLSRMLISPGCVKLPHITVLLCPESRKKSGAAGRTGVGIAVGQANSGQVSNQPLLHYDLSVIHHTWMTDKS